MGAINEAVQERGDDAGPTISSSSVDHVSAEHGEQADGCFSNSYAGGPVQTEWTVCLTKPVAAPPSPGVRLATPRLDDDNVSRRERQARRARAAQQQQQQVEQRRLPAKPVMHPSYAAGIDAPEGAGWQTLARERAVSHIAIDWDEAVTVEDLSSCGMAASLAMATNGSAVELVNVGGGACCAR
jgi:hypothetical protein